MSAVESWEDLAGDLVPRLAVGGFTDMCCGYNDVGQWGTYHTHRGQGCRRGRIRQCVSGARGVCPPRLSSRESLGRLGCRVGVGGKVGVAMCVLRGVDQGRRWAVVSKRVL